MENIRLPASEERMISHIFHQAEKEVEAWISLTATLLARLAQNVAIVSLPKSVDCKLKHMELLALQDECSRFKLNHRLAPGPANARHVYDYLKEAFEKHGPPLVIKHDGDKIFHEKKVIELFEKYDVVALTRPWTSSPLATSRRHTFAPTNPPAPVTKNTRFAIALAS